MPDAVPLVDVRAAYLAQRAELDAAVAGVVGGTALQQRLSGRAISLLFAAMLVVVALVLLIP